MPSLPKSSRRGTKQLLLFAVITLLSTAAATATAQGQQALKLPLPAGSVVVYADETYGDGSEHPTSGAIAFDLGAGDGDSNFQVLAIGDGDARLVCTNSTGASIISHRVDGYAGEFFYLHLQQTASPSWMTSQWTRVSQGQVLGRIFPGRIVAVDGESCLQFSSGPHLHLDLPTEGIVLDGIAWSAQTPNDYDVVQSTNRAGGPLPEVFCDGRKATIVGTAGDDVLIGTNGPDVIAALQGNDVVRGLAGDDVICGGQGNDALIGGQGFDVLFGAQGNDTLYAADGQRTSERTDTAGGRNFGGIGNDTIHGSTRWDRMQGGPGADRLYGYQGRDWMRGGPGNDLVNSGPGQDDARGGNGTDTVT